MSKQSRQEQRTHTRLVVEKYHKRKTYWTEESSRSVLAELHPNVVVKDTFVDMNTKICCYCEKDQSTWFVKPKDIVTDGTGCPVCARKNNGREYSRATLGIDSIASKYPHLIEYFVNKNDAYFYKYQSNVKVKLKCPYCGHEKSMYVYSLTGRGFSCAVCGDGVSYPNKVGRMLVLQLPVNNIEYEWHPTWMPGKSRFDIKFEYQNQTYVIEMDGYQHYVEDISFTHKKLSEIQANDKSKNRLCEEHNITMIRINCKDNSLKWIKEHIQKSEIGNIFDLSLVNWAKCEIYASTSLVVETSKLWNEGLDLLQIAQKLKVSRCSIQRYIKIAEHIGLCQYDKQRGLINGIIKNSRKIHWTDTDQEFINARVCAEEVFKQTGIKVTVSGIRAVAYGNQRHTKGFHFEFCRQEESDTCTVSYSNSKHVYCYDMSGKYVAEYDSILSAAEAMDVTEKSIIDCCNGTTKKSANHIWRYAEEIGDKEDFIVDLTKRGRKVDCLTPDGEYIETFPSAMVALRKYANATNSGIGRCCRGTQQLSGGYGWRYSIF